MEKAQSSILEGREEAPEWGRRQPRALQKALKGFQLSRDSSFCRQKGRIK